MKKLFGLFAAMGMMLIMVGCQSTGVADTDSPCFAEPPDAQVIGDMLLIRVHDSGREFMGVERPQVEFSNGEVILISSGFVQSAGGTRTFRQNLPKAYIGKDLSGKVFWVNSDGARTPIKVSVREGK